VYGAKRAGAHARVQPTHRYAWHGRSLLVTNERLECGEADDLTGYFFGETRHLRTLRLRINDATPWLCAEGEDGHAELAAVYIYPELTEFSGGGTDAADDWAWLNESGVTQRTIDIRCQLQVTPRDLVVVLAIANRSLHHVRLHVLWELSADFADIQEALSGRRQQTAPVESRCEGGELVFHYAHPELPLATSVRSAGGPWERSTNGLAAWIELGPAERHESRLEVTPNDGPDREPNDGDRDVERRVAHVERWRSRLATFETPRNTVVAELISQAADDLGSFALLDGPEDEWLAPQAGIPLYPALFGRDSVTIGWQAAMLDRGELLDASLTRLGRLQGTRDDPERDEEPGRIVQQVRSGPLSRLGCLPFGRYYGDFASPLAYVIALAHHFAWSGDRAFLERQWDAVRRILDWARDRGDRDRDGYLEYQTKSSNGAKNQGWKDSGNAILYEDGTPVPAPLATCELQGYWFAAQQLAAVLGWVIGAHEEAKAHWHAASELKARFNRDWWMEEEGCVALALDPDKRLARSVASNAGHCLASGIVADEHVPRLVGRLFAPDMFSGWGVRTLSTRHIAYNPLSYHLGTVWPVENATIVFGLRRFGFDARALDLAEGMVSLTRLYDRGRVPECVGGYARAEFPHPGAYPRANPIQGWNQSGLVLVMHSLLGLQPVAMIHTLFVDPALPPWLPEVTVRGLRLGTATATLRFWRDDSGASHADVLEKRGTFHLVRQPPPESLDAGIRDRLGALVETVRH
jgi:glycogen debranching enzyme